MTTNQYLVDNAIAELIFAHGAGADSQHELMHKLATLFNTHGINVTLFDFPYMQRRQKEGRRFLPDKMPILVEAFEQQIASLQTSLPLFIGGKSMGGRVAATIASTTKAANTIKGVLCFGYPFHPQKKPEKLRLAPLQQTLRPICIMQGERDALGSQTEIVDYEISRYCELNYFADGDHDLKPRQASGYTHQQHLAAAVECAVTFIRLNSGLL